MELARHREILEAIRQAHAEIVGELRAIENRRVVSLANSVMLRFADFMSFERDERVGFINDSAEFVTLTEQVVQARAQVDAKRDVDRLIKAFIPATMQLLFARVNVGFTDHSVLINSYVTPVLDAGLQVLVEPTCRPHVHIVWDDECQTQHCDYETEDIWRCRTSFGNRLDLDRDDYTIEEAVDKANRGSSYYAILDAKNNVAEFLN